MLWSFLSSFIDSSHSKNTVKQHIVGKLMISITEREERESERGGKGKIVN